MLNSVQIFDLVKDQQRLASDYALAHFLGCSPALICKHRKRPFGMDSALAMKCAEVLRFDPALLLLWTAVERAKCTKEKAALQRVAAFWELTRREEGCALPQ